MIDWTEQEEQEMIALAKAGDPRANFELSQWALERSEEEPDEIRWSRLAARCLLKSAQAGYAPAQQKMELLLKASAAESAQSKASSSKEPEEKSNDHLASKTIQLHPTGAGEKNRQSATTTDHSGVRSIRNQDLFDEEEEEEDSGEKEDDAEEEDDGRTRRKNWKKPTPFANWGETQWRRMELICIAICAVLIVAIIAIFLTSRRSSNNNAQADTPSVPQAGQVTTATAAPDLGPYPDASTKEEILSSDIEVQPADLDYVTTATSATITVGTENQTLRLRTGPNTNYRELADMPNGDIVDVYAKKDDWALVLYHSDDGPIYGWCNASYLITTSGSVG